MEFFIIMKGCSSANQARRMVAPWHTVWKGWLTSHCPPMLRQCVHLLQLSLLILTEWCHQQLIPGSIPILHSYSIWGVWRRKGQKASDHYYLGKSRWYDQILIKLFQTIRDREMKLIITDNRFRPHLPSNVPLQICGSPNFVYLLLKFSLIIYIFPKILTPGNT